jgi:hypothetical protein
MSVATVLIPRLLPASLCLHVDCVEARSAGRARCGRHRHIPRVRRARQPVLRHACDMTRVTRYDPDIDGAVPPRAAARARKQEEDADKEEQGEGSVVAAKDVNSMYLVMRERVAKMEARVDERLNQVRGQSVQPHARRSGATGGVDAGSDAAATGQVA